jgi:flagellar basal-body rod protein FlgB
VQQILDRVVGIHDDALRLRAYRSNILASNIANADTPGYKAKDIDFKSILSRQLTASGVDRVGMRNTHSGHIQIDRSSLGAEPQYRNPLQAPLDGNTVDSHIEYTRFAENTLMYQASLQFLGGRFKSLMSAIKGD